MNAYRSLFFALCLASFTVAPCASAQGKPPTKRLTNEECLNLLKPEMTKAEMDKIWRGRPVILSQGGSVTEVETGEMYSMSRNGYLWDFKDGKERMIMVGDYGNGTTTIEGPGFTYHQKSPDAKFIRVKKRIK